MVYNNIYRGILDMVMYLLVYLVIPIAQVVISFVVMENYLHIGILCISLSAVYDASSRMNEEATIKKRFKLAMIIIGYIFILCTSFIFLLISANQIIIDIRFYFLYSFILLPIIVCLIDMIIMIYINIRTGGKE